MLAAHCGLAFLAVVGGRGSLGRVNGTIAWLIADGSLGFEFLWRGDLRS